MQFVFSLQYLTNQIFNQLNVERHVNVAVLTYITIQLKHMKTAWTHHRKTNSFDRHTTGSKSNCQEKITRSIIKWLYKDKTGEIFGMYNNRYINTLWNLFNRINYLLTFIYKYIRITVTNELNFTIAFQFRYSIVVQFLFREACFENIFLTHLGYLSTKHKRH